MGVSLPTSKVQCLSSLSDVSDEVLSVASVSVWILSVGESLLGSLALLFSFLDLSWDVFPIKLIRVILGNASDHKQLIDQLWVQIFEIIPTIRNQVSHGISSEVEQHEVAGSVQNEPDEPGRNSISNTLVAIVKDAVVGDVTDLLAAFAGCGQDDYVHHEESDVVDWDQVGQQVHVVPSIEEVDQSIVKPL